MTTYVVAPEPGPAWCPTDAVRITPPRLATRALFRAAGRDAGRRVRARLGLRMAWDRLVTLPADATRVYAPSLGARETLAEARRRGIEAILVEDLPDLRGLHRDLDRAARRHPDCSLLRRFRASHATLARQEAERVLATERLCDRPGQGSPIEWGPIAPVSPRRGRRVLLCGLPVARNGSVEALGAILGLEGTLVARRGETVEPGGARLELVDPATLGDLDGIGVVIAPALCESRHAALAQASAHGIPTIATTLAAGRTRVDDLVEPGDVSALREALQRHLG